MTDSPNINAKELLSEIEAGLEGVTPGSYVSIVRHEMDREDSWSVKAQPHSALRGFSEVVADMLSKKDASHIARCSPDNLRAIIEYVRELEAENKRLCEGVGK